ncbi:hypothetical protein [Lapillicoccus sp.]|uniref:hypothetical protein n=1 Tax=Lapillicoccus sp. TaxID=1909287 RepID=UPI0025D14B0F|nr:hypothetical protein [Lapillicoccus sp.]
MTSPSAVAAHLSRVLPAIAVTVALFLFGAGSFGTPSGTAFLAAAVAALAVVLSSAGHVARPFPALPSRTGGASGHVDAPTAYWCAVQVPRRPAQPRAPGQR